MSAASSARTGGMPIGSDRGGRASSRAGRARRGAREGPHEYRKAKFQIGSCRGDRIHYPLDQSVFHVSDIPKHAMKAKIDVIRSKKKDILGTEKKRWNSTTSLEAPERRFHKSNQQLANDPPLGGMAYNFRAEVLPDKNPDFLARSNKFQLDSRLHTTGSRVMGSRRARAMPTHPRLEGKRRWNGCVSFTEQEKDDSMARMERARRRASRRSNAIVAAKKSYLSPQKQYLVDQAKRRAARRAQAEKEKALTYDKWGDPIKPADQGKLGLRNDGSEYFKPRRFATVTTRKFKKYEHSGVWEYNQVCGKWMWSDTGSEVKDSRGDIVTTVDPDAYNFASPYS